ncbi:WD40 repeat-like protein [Hyaloscypha variabilis]
MFRKRFGSKKKKSAETDANEDEGSPSSSSSQVLASLPEQEIPLKFEPGRSRRHSDNVTGTRGASDKGQSPGAPRPPGEPVTRSQTSSTTDTNIDQRRGSSPRGAKDPVGLNVVYNPERERELDIVFVHGLGGTSRLSWSKNKDPELFWPLTFLPLEPDICHARILTFGYNATILKANKNTSSILDFAKALLFDLKYGKGLEMEELNIGEAPVIFIVHSMGGLIVKEAYMQGKLDPEYESITKAISAIIFLATPHRGTNLADTLNRILQASFVSNSKQYITDLAQNSFILQKLNEQFRHVAPKLDIVSFYETRPTPIGFKKNSMMVVEKDSSVMGYPGEISKSLDADHHGVCKYESTVDPSYVTVRNVLKSLVSKILLSGKRRSSIQSVNLKEELQALEAILAISERPDVDYIFFRDRWAAGTCEWILQNTSYLDWLHSPGIEPQILWLHGGAASGKSILSSFIVNNLVEMGLSCQYFFIRFSDHNKRTLTTILRSLAFQLAQVFPAFCQRIAQLSDESISLENADARTIWQRVFKSILFKMEIEKPIYWIIDGLDESDTPRTVIKLLSEVSSVAIPFRILLVSRKTQELQSSFQKLPSELGLRVISSDEGHSEDFRRFVDQELEVSGTAEFKEEVKQRILKGARGNFLWMHLAIQKINGCHREADVEKALQQLPPGMEALYGRMAQSIADMQSETDKALSESILAWVTCSLRPLTVGELSQAMEKDTAEILDFQRSIVGLCGGFVVVDNSSNIEMVHQTAREYLLSNPDSPFKVNRRAAHEKIFMRCLNCLMTFGLRAKIARNTTPEFLGYAATSWFSHLSSSPVGSKSVLAILMKFFKGASLLTWIQFLAQNRQLRALVQATTHLTSFAIKRRELDAERSPLERRIAESEIIESWAVDLVKIVGKFGTNLLRSPESIHKSVPPFCPKDSITYQTFGRKEAKNLMVTGFSNTCWDDSLARISFGSEVYASSILAVGSHVAVLAPSGTVLVYHASTFEEIRQIHHGERVHRMQLNRRGSLLVSCGYATTKVWKVSTGQCIATARNPEGRPRAVNILFGNEDRTIFIAFGDKKLRSIELGQSQPTWELLADFDEEQMEGTFVNSPTCMALSPDGSLIALGYRGHPVSVWETDGPVPVGHCLRTHDLTAQGEETFGQTNQLFWHPYSGEVLGFYQEGVVFKWHPYEDERSEILTGTGNATMAMSLDGNFFATGDASGTIKVFSTADFCHVYQLASQDSVLDLTFSPDSSRFYDIRGSYTNVWEPNALIKLIDQTDHSSDNASEIDSLAQKSTVSENFTGKVDPVTALAASPTEALYCFGTEEGVVDLYEVGRGKVGELSKSKSFMTTEQITWSNNGRYVGFADLSGKVFVKSIKPNGDIMESWVVETKIEITINTTNGPIRQLLFNTDSSLLLVYTASTVNTVTLTSEPVVKSSICPAATWKWINHPSSSSLLLACGHNSIHVWNWQTLKEVRVFEFMAPRFDLSNLALGDDGTNVPATGHSIRAGYTRQSLVPNAWEVQDTVERVLVTLDGKNILIQTSHRKEKEILLFEVAPLTESGGATTTHFSGPRGAAVPEVDPDKPSTSAGQDEPTRLNPLVLPSNLASRIEIPLVFMSRDRLVFLDCNFWLCSWRLPLPSNIAFRRSSGPAGASIFEITEHYFLPGDWVNPDYVSLCRVMAGGTVLCPRNGEVAVVKCSTLAA